MTKNNIAAALVKHNPLLVSSADSSFSSGMQSAQAQQQQHNKNQVELNKSVGGRRRKKRRKLFRFLCLVLCKLIIPKANT